MTFFYLFFLFLFSANADESINLIKSNEAIVEMLSGPNNAGTDFWISIPPGFSTNKQIDKVSIFIGSKYNANVRYNHSSGNEKSINVIPGITNSFDIKPEEIAPFFKSDNIYSEIQTGVYNNSAINIISDFPITIYVMLVYEESTDGFLAIPKSSLGKEYIASNYKITNNNSSNYNMLEVIATEDNTQVEFQLGGNNNSKLILSDSEELSLNDKKTYNLNKGDVLFILNEGDNENIAGSKISANNPISVISANTNASVPVNLGGSDFTIQMEQPIHTWGQIYPIPKLNFRKKSSILNIFSLKDETLLYRDEQELFYFVNGVENESGNEYASWMETRIWPIGYAPETALYTSDKPIQITMYNTSPSDDITNSTPFQMPIIPLEQYQNEIMFYLPSSNGGTKYLTTWLNIIFETDENALLPEDMMFGEVNSDGSVKWNSVRSLFGAQSDKFHTIGSSNSIQNFEGSKFQNIRLAQKVIQLPSDKIYILKSPTLLTAYLSGYKEEAGKRVFFGYPIGNAFKKLYSGDLTPPNISWDIECYGTVIGNASDVGENASGLYSPSIIYEETENFSNIQYDEFEVGQNNLNWTMQVIDTEKEAKAVVSFYDWAGNSVKDTIEYTPSGSSIPKPTITIEGDINLCSEDDFVSIIIQNDDYAKVEWSNGEVSNTLTTNEEGEYFARVYDDNDCYLLTEKITIKRIDKQLIEMNTPPENIFCEGDEVEISLFNVFSDAEILWNTGAQTKDITITESGDYWAIYKGHNFDCYQNSKTFSVEFLPIPEKPEIVYDKYVLNIETEEEIIEWYLNDEKIDKYDNRKVIAPEFDGNYKVKVISSNGCENTSDIYVVNWMSVSGDYFKGISLNPNPNNGEFELRLSTDFIGLAELSIIDLQGQKVFNEQVNINGKEFKRNLKIENISKGIYFLKIQSGSSQINTKFIVE